MTSEYNARSLQGVPDTRSRIIAPKAHCLAAFLTATLATPLHYHRGGPLSDTFTFQA